MKSETNLERGDAPSNTQTMNAVINNSAESGGAIKRNYVVALVLSIFLGWAGIDRFYLGSAGVGILKLFTLGLFGVLWIIDIIMIATKSVKGVIWVDSSASQSDSNVKSTWSTKKKIIVTAAVIFTLLVFSSVVNRGSESESTSSNAGSATQSSEQDDVVEDVEYTVGDIISFDSKQVTVSNLERNWNSGNQFVVPDSGNEYVKVQVEIQNNSDNQISYNTFDWKIQNSNGVIKDVDSAAFMVDGGLESGELAAGGKTSGFIVFEVPAGDEGLVLQYSPSFWSSKKLEIKL